MKQDGAVVSELYREILKMYQFGTLVKVEKLNRFFINISGIVFECKSIKLDGLIKQWRKQLF